MALHSSVPKTFDGALVTLDKLKNFNCLYRFLWKLIQIKHNEHLLIENKQAAYNHAI